MSEPTESWPPAWGDPDDEDLEADEHGNGHPGYGQVAPDTLAEVTSFLASAPVPALPDAFATRISAAIAAEAATRTEPAGTVGETATVRSVPPRFSRFGRARRSSGRQGRAGAAGPGGSRPPGRWRDRIHSAPAIGALMVCLAVVAGLTSLALSRGNSAPTPNAAAGRSATAGRPAQGLGRPASRPAAVLPYGASEPADFTVRTTGTSYEPATLAGQVKGAEAAAGGVSSASGAAGPAAGSGGSTPTAALAGCVSRLTGGARPILVDRATYAGQPAYIVAVPGQAWVVGLGCRASDTELITSVALGG